MINRQQFISYAGLAVCGGLTATQANAQTSQTIAGVKFEPEITLGGRKLLLNGAGVRFKVIFKVYAAALYTPTKITKNEEALRTDSPKRMHLVALRTVGGDEFGKLFTKAMEANASREEFSKSINNVIKMGQIFADAREFRQGDVIMLDYTPAGGLIIMHKGKQMADAIKEPEFHSLLMKIWFGPKPADEPLRVALLGGQSSANTNVN